MAAVVVVGGGGGSTSGGFCSNHANNGTAYLNQKVTCDHNSSHNMSN